MLNRPASKVGLSIHIIVFTSNDLLILLHDQLSKSGLRDNTLNFLITITFYLKRCFKQEKKV